MQASGKVGTGKKNLCQWSGNQKGHVRAAKGILRRGGKRVNRMHGGTIWRKEGTSQKRIGVPGERKPIRTKNIMTYMHNNSITKLIISQVT